MKALKIAAIIASAISIAVVVPLCIIFMVKATGNEAIKHEYVIYALFTLMVLNIAVGGITIIRLSVDAKSYLFGAFTFLFVSPIAGVLYLIWNPNKKNLSN